MGFLDKIFPFLVGNRTELLGLATTILQVLGIFGVVDPQKVHEATTVLVPGMMTTFAAKMSRS